MLTILAGPFRLRPKRKLPLSQARGSTSPHRARTCLCNACVERRRLRELRRAAQQAIAGTVDRVATATFYECYQTRPLVRQPQN